MAITDTEWSKPPPLDPEAEWQRKLAEFNKAGVGSQGTPPPGFIETIGGFPNRINERPQVYDPNAGSFNLNMAGSNAEGWQKGLANQSGAAGWQQQLAQGQAGWSDEQFRNLQGQAGTDYTRAGQAYNQGQGALSMYEQAAQGNAPSVAAIQQQQGLEQAMANQRAMAASGPYNPAAGLMAAQNAAQMQGQSVNQQALLRAQEMAQARGQYGQMLGQQQNAALGLGGMTQAQQGVTANYGAGQRQYALGLGQERLGLQQEVRQVGEAQQGGQIQYEQLKGQQQIAAMQANEQRLEANQKATQQSREGVLGGLGAGIGAMAAMSDEASKQQLATAQSEIQNLRQQLSTMSMSAGRQAATGEGGMGGGIMSGMALGKLMSDEKAKKQSYLDGMVAGHELGLRGGTPTARFGPADEFAHVPARSFEYRPEVRAAYPEMTADGRRYGVTAQDLERAGPVGRSLVREGPGGYKAIDVPQATGALLAAVGQQQRELDALQASGPAVRKEELVSEGWDDFVRRSLAERAGR